MSLLGEKTIQERVEEIYAVADAARENILTEHADKNNGSIPGSILPSYSQQEDRLQCEKELTKKQLTEIKWLRKELQESRWMAQMILNLIYGSCVKHRRSMTEFTDEEIAAVRKQINECNLTREQIRSLYKLVINYIKQDKKKRIAILEI